MRREAATSDVRLKVVVTRLTRWFALLEEFQQVPNINPTPVVPHRVVAAPMPNLQQAKDSAVRGEFDALVDAGCKPDRFGRQASDTGNRNHIAFNEQATWFPTVNPLGISQCVHMALGEPTPRQRVKFDALKRNERQRQRDD